MKKQLWELTSKVHAEWLLQLYTFQLGNKMALIQYSFQTKWYYQKVHSDFQSSTNRQSQCHHINFCPKEWSHLLRHNQYIHKPLHWHLPVLRNTITAMIGPNKCLQHFRVRKSLYILRFYWWRVLASECLISNANINGLDLEGNEILVAKIKALI